MRVTRIDFTEDGPAPTIELSRKEAALIHEMLGGTSHTARDELMADGGTIGSDIYDELCSKWAYAFWEDGESAKGWTP